MLVSRVSAKQAFSVEGALAGYQLLYHVPPTQVLLLTLTFSMELTFRVSAGDS